MLEKIIMALKDTRALLSDHDRWAKRSWAYDAERRAVDSANPDAVCWCAAGAIMKMTYRTRGLMFPTIAAFAEAVEKRWFAEGWAANPDANPSDKITQFNDSESTYHHHVLEVFDEAIANLERSMKDA